MIEPAENYLWHEYDKVSTALENNQSYTMKIPPVVVTIILGLTVFRDVNNSLFGFGFPITIFFLVAWLGYAHSMINYYGLCLVRLEHKINSQIPPDSYNRLTFYSIYVGDGANILTGFKVYSVTIALVTFVVFLISLEKAWWVMSSWRWSLYKINSFLFILTLLVEIVCVNMLYVDSVTRKSKKEILTNKTK